LNTSIQYAVERPAIHSFFDGHFKMFNLRIRGSLDRSAIQELSSNSDNIDLFFQTISKRIFILALTYYPTSPFHGSDHHLISVRFSMKNDSYVIIGLDVTDVQKPWILNDKKDLVATELRSVKSLLVVRWREFALTKQ
jgi:hypothetical protein